MTIRPATRADLVWLRLLYAQLLDEVHPIYPSYDATDLEAFTLSLATRLETDPDLICWVAEDGPIVGGFGVGELLRRRIGHPRLFAVAHWLYIIPLWRQQGVGRHLSSAIIEDFARRGAEAMELAAVPNDLQWAKRGWTPVAMTYSLTIAEARTTLTPSGPKNGSGEHPPAEQAP